jgi:hypothetical protein
MPPTVRSGALGRSMLDGHSIVQVGKLVSQYPRNQPAWRHELIHSFWITQPAVVLQQYST